jgi:hypothetical protein
MGHGRENWTESMQHSVGALWWLEAAVTLGSEMYTVCAALVCCPPTVQDVVWRVTSSFLGPLKPDFMATTLESPDLYGPFWVATTLVFVTAVAGNYAAFLSHGSLTGIEPGTGGSNSTSTLDQQWYTNYSQVGYSALLFYGYVFVLGLALFFILRWFNSQVRASNGPTFL